MTNEAKLRDIGRRVGAGELTLEQAKSEAYALGERAASRTSMMRGAIGWLLVLALVVLAALVVGGR